MSCSRQEYDLDMDVENMCRICLSQTDTSERLFNIFSSAIVDGFLVSIPDVIQFSVDLKVIESDGMPGKICQKCKGQLLNFYLFKQKCKRTEKILQEAFASSMKENNAPSKPVEFMENAKFSNTSDHMVEILEHEQNYEEVVVTEGQTTSDSDVIPLSDQVDNQCHLCDQMFHTEEDLKNHAATHCTIVKADHVGCVDDEQYEEYVVEMDDKNALVRTDAVSMCQVESPAAATDDDIHYIDDEEPEALESVEQLSNDPEDNISSVVADDNDLQSTHSDEVTNENVPQMVQLHCNICGKTVKGRSRYLKHLRMHDASTSVTEYFTYHICTVCLKVYLHGAELSDHMNATDHHQCTKDSSEMVEAPYVCGVCSAEHIKIDHMKQHLLSHLNSFPCPFEGCGCEYISPARLGIHIANKHIEYESHQCQHCGADSFESMAELQQHLRLKCSGKKFHCDHCDKKFMTSRSLAHHLKCLEKKHRCTECGKTFAQHGELKLHQRMHNGERPFKCTVCGKCYKTASLRTAHMDSHIEGKTFPCHLCGKHLQTRTCYRNHIKRHSEERKHECDVCSKKFYTKYNVKIHKEKVHKLNQQAKGDN